MRKLEECSKCSRVAPALILKRRGGLCPICNGDRLYVVKPKPERKVKTMSIADGKKRFILSLTTKNVHMFRDACKRLGMPPSSLSTAVDEYLEGMVPMLDTASKSGKLTVTDFFTYMGTKVQEMIDEEKLQEEEKKNVVEVSPAKKIKRSSN